MNKIFSSSAGLIALLIIILLPFLASAQVVPAEVSPIDTTHTPPFSFEVNVSSSNVWLLNGMAYGVNEPNAALTVQYTHRNFYAYAYKANSLVKQVSDGNYATVGVGHKAVFKTNTFIDLNFASMFMQHQRFYEGYRSRETQLFASAFLTQQLVTGKHFINLQPVWVIHPGYGDAQAENDNLLIRADYEYRNEKLGTFNALYYYSYGVGATSTGSAVGFNYLKRFPLTSRFTGKATITAIKNINERPTSYFKDVLSVGYSVEF